LALAFVAAEGVMMPASVAATAAPCASESNRQVPAVTKVRCAVLTTTIGLAATAGIVTLCVTAARFLLPLRLVSASRWTP
jgi:hypothetical protein